MPKSSTPVRLQAELMERAAQAGARHHRSAAQQIEYWAALGQQVAGLVDPDSLLAVQSGVARLTVEPVQVEPPDPQAVFAALEADRVSGVLASQVTTTTVRYQACAGRFHNGAFQPLERIDA